MKNSTKRLLAALGLLTAFTMALSACNNDSGGGTSGGTSGQTSGTSADTQSESQSETTTAPPTTTTAAPETVAPMEVLADKGEVVYDALDSGDMDGYIDYENLPGCPYPADQGNPTDNGSGRICNAGDIIAMKLDKGIYVSNRVNTWDSIDITLGDLEPGDYTVQVKFSASNPVWFAISFSRLRCVLSESL